MRSLLSSPLLLLSAVFLAPSPSIAYPHDDSLVNWNINVNPDAGANVLNYDSERGSGRNTTYTPSPDNWRALPFYNILLDKFAVRLLHLLSLTCPRRFFRWVGSVEAEGHRRARAAVFKEVACWLTGQNPTHPSFSPTGRRPSQQ